MIVTLSAYRSDLLDVLDFKMAFSLPNNYVKYLHRCLQDLCDSLNQPINFFLVQKPMEYFFHVMLYDVH